MNVQTIFLRLRFLSIAFLLVTGSLQYQATLSGSFPDGDVVVVTVNGNRTI